jgi:hypothetical protein
MTAPVEHVEGGEQRGGVVTLVVVGDAFDVAEPHGKHGLGAFEGLDLALLIDAKHYGLVGRIEIKPDHVAQLLDEEGIGGKLEAAGAVRLQTEELGRCSWQSWSLRSYGTRLQTASTRRRCWTRARTSTIFARNVSAAGSERDRVLANKCARSSLEIASVVLGHPVRIG